MTEAPSISTPRPADRQQLLWVIRGLALGAAAVAGYLAVVALSQRGLPLGCGSGSGCDEVLRSRWSSLFGIPIGAFALVIDLGVVAATFLPVRTRRFLLVTLAVCLAGAATWFVTLQLALLRAICWWCMADHILGLATAGAIFAFVRSGFSADDGAPQSPSLRQSALVGVTLTTLMIVLQVGFGTSGAGLIRLPESENADTGPGPNRHIGVLGGRLQLSLDEVPVLGSADARVPIVILYDYCCPHCRATHGDLVDGLARYASQYCIVLLPMPLDADCNDSVEETEPRFEDACELAHLALAVWTADPEQFAAFDSWLYEPELPRTASDARQFASSLVGEQQLTTALTAISVENRIQEDIQAYIASGAQQIPVLLSPGMDSIVGRAENAEELFHILEQELGIRPAET